MSPDLRSLIPVNPGVPGSRGAIASAVDLAVSELGPDQVILFGSGARGEMDAGSDIDLLVVRPFPEGEDPPNGLDPAGGGWSASGIAVHVMLTDRERAESKRFSAGDLRQRALSEGCTLYVRPGASPVGTRLGPPEATAMAHRRRALDYSGAPAFVEKSRRQLAWLERGLGGGGSVFEDGTAEAAFGCAARSVECSLKAVCLTVGVNPPADGARGHNLGHIAGVIEEESPAVGRELRAIGLAPDLLKRLSSFLGRGFYDDSPVQPSEEDLDASARAAARAHDYAAEAVRRMQRGPAPPGPLKTVGEVFSERRAKRGPGR